MTERGANGRFIAKASFGGTLPSGAVAMTNLGGLAQALAGGPGSSISPTVTSSLGPGIPIGPAHPDEGIPRWWDYTPGYNVQTTPRAGESYGFELLYGLANAWDVTGLAIEKRKEEFVKLEPTIRPKQVPGQTRLQAQRRADALREQIADAMGFLSSPDRQSSYSSWLNRYLDDLFKGDCATFYERANRGGGLAAIEVPDGTTIKPIIDLWGRIAQVPPGTPRHTHIWAPDNEAFPTAGAGVGMACQICATAPAYAQVVKGMIWGWYGSDEMIYQPRWLRGKGPYGHPPAEWIILSINRALRRQSLDLAYYTEGTLPAAFLKIPESWTVEQGQVLLSVIDKIYAGNDALRSRMIPIPGGPNAGVERVMPEPENQVEEYLLHVGCAAYAVPPMELGFIRSSGGSALGGKGVSDNQGDAARARQFSLSVHIREVYNRILAKYWTPDIVLIYPSLEERKDQLAEAQTLKEYWSIGAISTDWIATNVLQVDPPGLDNVVVTAQGTVVPIATIAGATPPTQGPAPSRPPTPHVPTPPRSPSAETGISTAPSPIGKALGGGKLEFHGDLGQVVHRYLLRSYPAADVAWALDSAIDWTYEPDLELAELDMGRRPGGRDEAKVDHIESAVANGASMDPIVVVEFATPDPAGLVIADGFHRSLAVAHAGKDALPAFVGRHVPDEYHELIAGPMQADSASKHPREDLRKWRQKAIRAVKRGDSAAVPFASEVISPAQAQLITAALERVRTVDEVWSLFAPREAVA